jgi:hypothetical protein
MPPFATFIGPTYQGASRIAGNERCVGFYLEKNETPGAVYPWTLQPTPGLVSRATTAEGPGRGAWSMDGRSLLVQGHALYELSTAWAATNRGAIARDDNPAQLASNGDGGDEVAIASAGEVKIFNLATNVLSAAIVGLTGHQVGYLDSRFLALNLNDSTWRISDRYDGTTWDPTQEEIRSTAPDRWKALCVAGKYIFLPGSETTDIYYDAGLSPFPFAPIDGALLPVGIAASWSIAVLLGNPAWLTQSGQGQRSVVWAQGTGMPRRISTHAMEFALNGYASVSDARGDVFELEGHAFYKLTFPSAGATWLFDAASGQWTEWPYWNSVTGQEEAHLTAAHCFFNGFHVVTSRSNGDIYTLGTSTYTDNGATIRRVRRVPIPKLSDDALWIFLSEIELHMDAGIGLQVAAGTAGYDPQVALRISRDGGNTWGTEISVSAGKIGEYLTRVIFNRLGRYRDGLGVVEFIFTDPVPYRISGASMQTRPGIS